MRHETQALGPGWILALTAACLVVTGILDFTFARSTVPGLEPNNLLVIIVKFLLWITCVLSLILSFRQTLPRSE